MTSLSVDVRGDGPPIVCLPAFALSGAAMARALEPALDGDACGRQRLYVDLPGVGRSPSEGEDSEAVLASVRETIEQHVGASPYALAGWSYGGYLAAALARRFPEQVTGLLLVCPGVRVGVDERDVPDDDGEPAPDDNWLDDAPEDLKAHLTQAIGRRTRAVARLVADVVESGGPRDDPYLDRLHGDGFRLADQDSTASFAGPTAVVTGRADRVAGFADQYRALVHYPRASFAVVGDAGHYLPFETPDVLHDLVRAWLARLP